MSTSPRFRTFITLVLGAMTFAVVVPAHAAPSAAPTDPAPVRTVAASPASAVAAASRSAGPQATVKFKKKVIGNGTAKSCTYAKLAKAVRSGGDIRFNCGPDPVTIVVKKTLVVCNTHNCEAPWRGGKIVSKLRINGGGKVTLSGGGERGIFYANTCDEKLAWLDAHCASQTTPHVIFRNLTFRDGDATHRPAGYDGVTGGGGGGAIAMRGGRLTVKNSTFVKNRCVARHSDAGGGAIRLTGQSKTARIFGSTFKNNRCANGGAVSALLSPMRIKNSTFVKNRATGSGASDGQGGNGGAIYFDGLQQGVRVQGSKIRKNHAPEGGPGIFYVSNNRSGSLAITKTRIVKNTGAKFHTRPWTSIFFLGKKITTTGSKIT